MIKSTKTTLKYTNPTKLNNIHEFIDEYRLVVKQFVDILWDLKTTPTLLPKTITSQITTWLSKRAIQCAGKQSSAIVRGTKQKQKQRLYIYNKLLAEGRTKQANKLKAIIDSVQLTKPNINEVEPELDARFVKQDWNSHTLFDGIITLSSLGKKLKLPIPVKKHKHFNKLSTNSTIKPGIRLSKSNITFIFELPETPPKQHGQTIGLDIGILNTYTTSDKQTSKPDAHHHTLQSINQKLSRKKKGSQAFLKAQQHRTNYINWTINQLNLVNTKTLKLEKIIHLRRGSNTSRYLSHFTYTEIYDKLKDLCNINGCSIEYINPTYTSQRCSECGWVRSSNRKGKQFKCGACKYECDSDYNAALNIATELAPIGAKQRLKHKNKKGFYWNASGKEFIVSSTQKPSRHKCL